MLIIILEGNLAIDKNKKELKLHTPTLLKSQRQVVPTIH